MKFLSRCICVSLAGLLALVSCAKVETESYDHYEDQALEAWMKQHRPQLLENKQTFGTSEYYIDVLDAGNPDAKPVNDTICWVKFDFSGRDLSGNIILSRNAQDASLAGTFTKQTHYVPYYRYCGEENGSLLEGTWLAMREMQVLGQTYFDTYKNDPERRLTSRELLLREGSKVVLYMPSRVVGSGGVEGDGGYEGQYSLSTGRPFIVTMEICGTVKNPLEDEGSEVDDFCKLPENGGLQIYSNKTGDEAPEGSIPLPTDPKDGKHPYKIGQRWVSACDSVPQVYVNYRYRPEETLSFPAPYAAGREPYLTEGSLAQLNRDIADALKKRFYGEGEDAEQYKGVVELDADSVKLDGKAKIWYIGRFLDGFIFDTNIDEVKKLVFGKVEEEGSALEYTPEEGGMIQAFYYTVPNLKFGQWAALVTTSTNAYGAVGKNGTTITETSGGSNGYSSGYYDYMNYLNYANSYYGNSYGSYYGGYYGGYGGYGNGYYDPYYGYGYDYDYSGSNTGSTETTTKVTTEILPFTPLVFQFYVEPAE